MVSNLTALADRNFITGFLLPAVLAAIALLFTFQDIAWVRTLWTAIFDANSLAKLTLPLLGVWTSAVFLSVLNVTLYRWLEGYTGPLRTNSRKNRALAKRRARRDKLQTLHAEAKKGGANSQAWYKYFDESRKFTTEFPPEAMVMPTELGNLMRASQAYPLIVYGVDAIAAWLRLVEVVPVDHQDTMKGARAEVNFFVNGCALSTLLVLICVIYVAAASLLAHDIPWREPTDIRCSIAAAAGTAGAYLSYRFAINRARIWGNVVRSTFDLYLPDLARKLGYQLPRGRSDRIAFWSEINAMLLDLKPIASEHWPTTNAEPEPPSAAR